MAEWLDKMEDWEALRSTVGFPWSVCSRPTASSTFPLCTGLRVYFYLVSTDVEPPCAVAPT